MSRRKRILLTVASGLVGLIVVLVIAAIIIVFQTAGFGITFKEKIMAMIRRVNRRQSGYRIVFVDWKGLRASG